MFRKISLRSYVRKYFLLSPYIFWARDWTITISIDAVKTSARIFTKDGSSHFTLVLGRVNSTKPLIQTQDEIRHFLPSTYWLALKEVSEKLIFFYAWWSICILWQWFCAGLLLCNNFRLRRYKYFALLQFCNMNIIFCEYVSRLTIFFRSFEIHEWVFNENILLKEVRLSNIVIIFKSMASLICFLFVINFLLKLKKAKCFLPCFQKSQIKNKTRAKQYVNRQQM